MNKFLGILAVVLFWIAAITLAPVILSVGIAVFLLSIFIAISSLVYETVTNYLEKK